MPDRERKGVPEHMSNVLKGSLAQGPSSHPKNTENANIRGKSSFRMPTVSDVCLLQICSDKFPD